MIRIAADCPPGAFEDLWILERCFDLECIEVDSPNAFGHVKCVGVPEGLMTVAATDCAFSIESDGVDYQVVSFPTTDRIPEPTRSGLMRSAIEWDSAEQVHVFIMNHDVVGILDDLERIRTDAWWNGTDDTVTNDVIRIRCSSVGFHTGLQRGLCREGRLRSSGIEGIRTLARTETVEHSLQIRPPIRRAQRRAGGSGLHCRNGRIGSIHCDGERSR